jgi:hypothetical protein
MFTRNGPARAYVHVWKRSKNGEGSFRFAITEPTFQARPRRVGSGKNRTHSGINRAARLPNLLQLSPILQHVATLKQRAPERRLEGLFYAGVIERHRCTASALRVAEVVLLSLRIGAHILRRHQPGIMAKRLELPAQMMRTNTGPHAYKARRHIGEPRFTCPRHHFRRNANASRGSVAKLLNALHFEPQKSLQIP